MATYTIKNGTLEDYYYIADNLRPLDQKEMKVLFPQDTFRELLEHGFKQSHFTQCIYIDDKPVAAFGVAGNLGAEGIPWLLATEEFYSLRFTLIKKARKTIKAWFKYFKSLSNVVLAENEKAVKFIKHCGFKIISEYHDGKHLYYGFSKEVG